MISLYQNYKNGRRVDALTSEVSKIADVARAERETKRFMTGSGFPRSKYLCSHDSITSRLKLCDVLVLKSFERLGSHDDLWVALDAITVFADQTSLPKDIRRQLTKYHADLAAALSQDGAFHYIIRDAEEKPTVYSNDIYDAILSQAVVCNAMPNYRVCTNGLPNNVRTSLRGLVDLVLSIGPNVNPYEMKYRLESVRRLISSGVV